MERRAIAIRGTVQGVGFRPFVYHLASTLDLGGFVKNQTSGVAIEVEGATPSLDEFVSRLVSEPPPLARIEGWSCENQPPRGDRQFRIDPSDAGSSNCIAITPDAATCDACLAELFDPGNRRYRYPFLNCTNCGPRLTIVEGAPYDRHRTTMSAFTMCPACRREYENPADRRFHAQPNACPACGPQLTLLDPSGRTIETNDPLAGFVAALRKGKIGAMKGLGGYHLVCDAGNAEAVRELRRRKHRDEKPFAVMVRDVEAAEACCEVDAESQKLLVSPRRPIVLLPKRDPVSSTAFRDEGARAAIALDAIAPGNRQLGVMLPYTPLHHLLLHDMAGVPLVMTSGNRSDEPIAYQDDYAIDRLGGIADVFLVHNRRIHVRCDDSVTRVIDGAESPIRRSRGYAPQQIALPMECAAPILAVGGQLKATFALGNSDRAVLSHHMGDLDHFEALTAFETDVTLYEKLFSLHPKFIAHDLHPDYASTHYATRREPDSAKRIAIQHHHAHMASCMAEHGLTRPVIGVTLDGTGFGTDGAIWGGEFLVGDYRSFIRAAHLRYVPMPGGEQAVREPWRMALSHLLDSKISCRQFEDRQQESSLRTIRQMLARRFNCPPTSSAGRLFDAVAALVGVRGRVSYEGQAAMELQALAEQDDSVGSALADASYTEIRRGTGGSPVIPVEKTMGGPPMPRCSYPIEYIDPAQPHLPLIVDTRPMIRAIAADVENGIPAAQIARQFHMTCVDIIATICGRIRSQTGIDRVVFSGGVFMNALLSVKAAERLHYDGFTVYRHRLVPPNDGGLSLGQLAIAASQVCLA